MRGIVLFLTIAFCTGCGKRAFFDPFSYDPQAYEKVKLHYFIQGKGDTTLFFIHGWNLDHSCWQNQLAYFSPSYRLVTMDLAGHGHSGKKRKNWTVESFARDILHIIHTEGLKNVILVAHSMGGEIALDVAAADPRRVIGIIGVDNLKNVGMTVSEEQKKGMQSYIRMFKGNYREMAEGMARGNLRTRDSAIVAGVVKSYTSAKPKIAVPILMNLFPKAVDAKNKLAVLPFPLKLIISTYSSYDSAALKKYCRNGYRVVKIDGSGHFPMLEQPLKFNEALQGFLKPARL